MNLRSRCLSVVTVAAALATSLLGCGAGEEDEASAASRYETDSSPFDERVWEYELPLLDDHERLGCDYEFYVRSEKLYAGQHFTADWVYANGRVLKGEMRSKKPWPKAYGVATLEVIQRCNDGSGEDARPDTIGYRGESTIDLVTLMALTEKPGTKAGLPVLNTAGPISGPAGKSIKFTYRGVEKAPPLKQDANCAGTDPKTTDRFYMNVWVDTYPDKREYTVTLDDGRYVTESPMRGWYTYCRPKAEGTSKQVKVAVDAVDRRAILRDRVYEAAPVVATAGEGEVRIEHKYKGEYVFGSVVTVLQ